MVSFIYVTFKWAGAGKLAPGGAVTGEGEEGDPGSWQCPISPLGGAYVAVFTW